MGRNDTANIEVRKNPFEKGMIALGNTEYTPGEPVAAVVGRALGRNRIYLNRYSIDGRVCAPSEPVTNGPHEIRAWTAPEGGISWAAVGMFALKVAAVSAVSAAISIGVGALVKKKPTGRYGKQLADVSDEQYGWDYDARNAVAEGAPVPVLYGERLLTPPVVMQKARTENSSGESTLEVVYAVAEGGGGFGDEVEYPVDGNGDIQARINHASWRNFNSDELGSSSEATWNWMRPRNVGVTAYVNYDTTGMTGGYPCELLTNGKTDDKWNDFSDFLIATGISSVNNIYWNTGTLITPTSMKVYSYFARGNFKAIVGFTLYGLNTNGVWEQVGRTTNATGSTPCVCTLTLANPDTTKKYRQFYIGDFVWKSQSIRGQYGMPFVAELDMRGTRSSSGRGMSGSAMIQVNNGGFEQEPHSLQSGTWGSLAVEKTLDTNDFIFRTSPNAYPDKLGLHLVFPYGLYSVNEQTGDFSTKTVSVIGKFRPYGATEWTAFDGLSLTGRNISDSTQSQKALYYEQDVSAIGAESYEVCVKFSRDPAPSAGEQCECVWSGLDEGWGFNCSYPRTATALLKMLATQLVSGSAPQFRILAARRTLNVYDSVNGEWIEVEASNPAWAAYDLLVRPVFDDRDAEDSSASAETLIREAYPHTGLVYTEFREWADFCDDNGISMSMYYDGVTTVKSALEYVCEIGRASIVNRGAILGVHIDRAAREDADGNPVTVFNFDDSNVIKDSWRCSYRAPNDLYTQVNVTFFDKEREYSRFTVIARDPSFDVEGAEQNIKDVTLFCCDSRKVAEDYADYVLKQNLIRRTFEWKGDLDAMPLDIGDVVKLYDDYVVLTSVTYDRRLGRAFTGVEYVPARFNVKTVKQRLAEAINERMLAKSANVMTPGATWEATSYDGTEDASVLALAARDAMIGFASENPRDGAGGTSYIKFYTASNTKISLDQGDFFDEDAWMLDCYKRVRSVRYVVRTWDNYNFSHVFAFASETRQAEAWIAYPDGATEDERKQRLDIMKRELVDALYAGTATAGTAEEGYAMSGISETSSQGVVDGNIKLTTLTMRLTAPLVCGAIVRAWHMMGVLHEVGAAWSYDSFGVSAPFQRLKLACMYEQAAGEGVQSPGISAAGEPYFLEEQDSVSERNLEWLSSLYAISLDYSPSFSHLGERPADDDLPDVVDDSSLVVTVSGVSTVLTKTDPSAVGSERVWENEDEGASIYYTTTRGRWYLSIADSGISTFAVGGADSNPWELEWDDQYVTVSLPE